MQQWWILVIWTQLRSHSLRSWVHHFSLSKMNYWLVYKKHLIRTVARKSSVGDFTLKIWQKLHWFLVFHISFGDLELCLVAKPTRAQRVDGTACNIFFSFQRKIHSASLSQTYWLCVFCPIKNKRRPQLIKHHRIKGGNQIILGDSQTTANN